MGKGEDMKEKIKQLLIRISYDYRRQKKVEAYTKMKEKYSSMSKEEFSTEYVETKAEYEYKKNDVNSCRYILCNIYYYEFVGLLI